MELKPLVKMDDDSLQNISGGLTAPASKPTCPWCHGTNTAVSVEAGGTYGICHDCQMKFKI